MSSVAWTTIEDAIQAAIVAGSGLPDNHVIWTDEPGERPAGTYISMMVDEIDQPARDYTETKNNPSPTDGAELVKTTTGARQAMLRLQCFAGVDATTQKPIRGSVAMKVLADVMSSIEDQVDTLDAAGVGIGDMGLVRRVSSRRGSLLDPRATLDIEIHFGSQTTGTLGSIEHVEMTVNETTTGASREAWVPDPPTP